MKWTDEELMEVGQKAILYIDKTQREHGEYKIRREYGLEYVEIEMGDVQLQITIVDPQIRGKSLLLVPGGFFLSEDMTKSQRNEGGKVIVPEWARYMAYHKVGSKRP